MIFRTKTLLFLWVATIAAACGSGNGEGRPPWQSIDGRDEGADTKRVSIYRARVPTEWEVRLPKREASIADTKLPLVEYVIKASQGEVTIAVHNFPYDELEGRIPPQAQVSRWRQQVQDADPTTVAVEPYGHGGFAGLRFMATGTLSGVPNTTVVAWAQQLSQEHFRNLQRGGDVAQRRHDRQQRGDYTIKVWGPASAVAEHYDAIARFARSFELIEEVPGR